jgi:hypothetical protein
MSKQFKDVEEALKNGRKKNIDNLSPTEKKDAIACEVYYELIHNKYKNNTKGLPTNANKALDEMKQLKEKWLEEFPNLSKGDASNLARFEYRFNHNDMPIKNKPKKEIIIDETPINRSQILKDKLKNKKYTVKKTIIIKKNKNTTKDEEQEQEKLNNEDDPELQEEELI